MFKYIRLILATFSFMVCASCLPMTEDTEQVVERYKVTSCKKGNLKFTLRPMLCENSNNAQYCVVELDIEMSNRTSSTTQTIRSGYYDTSDTDRTKFKNFFEDINNIEYIKKLNERSYVENLANVKNQIIEELAKKFGWSADMLHWQESKPVITPISLNDQNNAQQSSWYSRSFVRYASMAAVAGVVAYAGWKLLNRIIS